MRQLSIQVFRALGGKSLIRFGWICSIFRNISFSCMLKILNMQVFYLLRDKFDIFVYICNLQKAVEINVKCKKRIL